MTRRDKFGQAISYWRAQETDQWQSAGSQAQSAPELEYDFGKIRKCFVELSGHDLLWQGFHNLAGTAPYEGV